VRYDEPIAERPERTSLRNNKALQQIEQQTGAAFDPALTEVFCLTMREQPSQRCEIARQSNSLCSPIYSARFPYSNLNCCR
jgi:HD-GYP domain-containing protein (c-di-GMP phosphodiesterase class II)